MHLSDIHPRMSVHKPEEIQHAIGNDREPNRRPRRLADKIGENLVARYCLKPQFIPAIALSRPCAPFR